MDSENSDVPLLTSRIRDLNLTKPVILDARISIREAAAKMRARRLDALLVRDETRHGVLTSADIRDALALSELPVETPIGSIATWKLVMVSPDELLFKALLLMTKRAVNRVVVGTAGHVSGILGLSELLSFLTNHASLTIQRILRAASLAELTNATSHQPHLVDSLISKGVKARHISRLVRELNRQVFEKAAKLLAPPDLLDHISIVVMGSEGRGEQIIKSDQDNGLIADENCSGEACQAFAHAFSMALTQLGYPLCPGNVMMTNPQWSGRISDYETLIRSWVREPSHTNLMQLAIFFDARTVAGQSGPWRSVRDALFEQLPNDPSFYAHFARPMLSFETPLGIFNRFIVEKGEKQGQIDLKKGGVFPIVHGVRSLALEHRLKDPNTIHRIRGLVRRGVLETSLGTDLIDAFDFLSGLRVRVKREARLRHGGEGDYLLVDDLGRLEKEYLRDSLGVVDGFKELITHHFRLRQFH
ncbi:MAG: CBS domain-containing protein [Magnetococcales bacterium]|nr:CBS domain-containing protein [Magnetococcales bacterium]